MKPKTWFRIAAILLFLFAIGHTAGFLTFRPPTAEGRAVLEAMNNTRVSIGNATFSYGGFYVGFGLFVSAFLLFLGWLAWIVGNLPPEQAATTRLIGFSMLLMAIVSAVLSLRYFPVVPLILSVATALCLLMGLYRLRQHRSQVS